MDNNLIITTVQSNLYWENKEKNFYHFQQIIENLKNKTDIIILPEMFTTGFSMKPSKFAEKMTGNSVKWLQKMSVKTNSGIIGSIIIEEENNYYNRLIFAKPDSSIEYYDKRHLFGMANEDKFYTAGNTQKIFEYKKWKIKALICYDLRFPVWSRNNNNYDILLFVANWPEKRIMHWKTLLKARAIENQAFVIGVNRIGKDGNGIPHSGDTATYNPNGEKISKTKANIETTETLTLFKNDLVKIKEKLPFSNDRDLFKIKILKD